MNHDGVTSVMHPTVSSQKVHGDEQMIRTFAL